MAVRWRTVVRVAGLLLAVIVVYVCTDSIGLWLKSRSAYFHNDQEFMRIHLDRTENVTRRMDLCNRCNVHSYRYIIDNNHTCKVSSRKADIELVIFILTKIRNYQRREALRKTWLSPSIRNTGKVRYIFILGRLTGNGKHDKYWQSELEEESKVYKDILQEDFIDSYGNLTLKTMMGFKYASTRCQHAKFVMKVDDDVWTNIPTLLSLLRRQQVSLQSAIGGHCHQTYMLPRRNRKDRKWYVSYHTYPREFYPLYCSGFSYVTSTRAAADIYFASFNVPFLHIEDVYIGLCVKQLGYKTKHLSGFILSKPKGLDLCMYKVPAMVSVHAFSPEEQYELWTRSCNVSTMTSFHQQM